MKIVIFLIPSVIGLSWLGVKEERGEQAICHSGALDYVQKRLCNRNGEYAMALSHAAAATVKSCQVAMVGHRWGCRSVSALPILSRNLKEASPESAFVHALSSAQLVSSLYRLCQSGTIGDCSLEEINRFSTEFTDVVSIQKRRKSQGAIEMHNSAIGRNVAWQSTRRICKCHGQSGSCTQKTCWQTAPDESDLTKKLTKKYEGAAMIRLTDSRIPKTVTQFIARDRLLYSEPKKAFCGETHGRECDPESTKSDNCRQLCCDRGFIQKRHTEIEEDCKFIWPAEIRCTPRAVTVEKHLCR